MYDMVTARLGAHQLVDLLDAVDVSHPLADSVGSWARLKDPQLSDGLAGLLPFKLAQLQHDWRHKVVFRGYNQALRFGRPLDPDRLEFLTEAGACRVWNAWAVEIFVNGEDLAFKPEFDYV